MSSQTVKQDELIALNRQLRDALRRDRARLLKVMERVLSASQKDARRFVRTVTLKTLKDVQSELSSGADPNATSADGEPAILIAATRGKRGYKIVAALLAAGADVDATDSDGNTALIANSRDADLELLKVLVKAGADVNRSNDQGDTALTNAATWGEAATVKYLVSQGADPSKRDGAGLLPADLAAQHGHAAIESALRQLK